MQDNYPSMSTICADMFPNTPAAAATAAFAYFKPPG
jgi:hypothetical protein